MNRARRLSAAQQRAEARRIVLEELANHLEGEWSDSALQLAQGRILAERLRLYAVQDSKYFARLFLPVCSA